MTVLGSLLLIASLGEMITVQGEGYLCRAATHLERASSSRRWQRGKWGEARWQNNLRRSAKFITCAPYWCAADMFWQADSYVSP